MLNSVEETKEFIRVHEGKVNKINKDILGYATFGIVHLFLPEDDLQVGVEYSDMAVYTFFKKDFHTA